MDGATCQTPLSARTLVENSNSFPAIHPSSPETQHLSPLDKICNPKTLQCPERPLETAQVREAVNLLSQWIQQECPPVTPLQTVDKAAFSPLSTPLKAMHTQSRLSKGASRIKTWVKESKHGLTFRVHSTHDSGDDKITDLDFKWDGPIQSEDVASNLTVTPSSVELDADGQQIQELPAEAAEVFELPAEHHDPPPYATVDHAACVRDSTWHEFQVPESAGTAIPTDNRSPSADIPQTAAESVSGVTRLKSTSQLLKKIRQERLRHRTVRMEKSSENRKYSSSDRNVPITIETALCEEEDPVIGPPGAAADFRKRNERILLIESIWETLLIEQVYLLGETRPLVAEARQDYVASKTSGHRKPRLAASLRKSCDLASQRLGLIHPVIRGFSEALQTLEDCLSQYHASDEERPRSVSGPGNAKAASAPVSPIDDGNDDDHHVGRTDLIPEAMNDYAQGIESHLEPAIGRSPRLRASRSLPSVRQPCHVLPVVDSARITSKATATMFDSTANRVMPSPEDCASDTIKCASNREQETAGEELRDQERIIQTRGSETTNPASELRHRANRPDRTTPIQSWIRSPSLDRLSRKQTFGHLVMNGLVEMLREGSNFIQRVAGAEPIPPDHVRVYWQCSCGAQLHDDFIENQTGAATEMENQLNGVQSQPGSNASSPVSAGPDGGSIFSSPANSLPSTATTWSTSNSAANSPTGPKPTRLPSGSHFSITVPERNPPYLLTCANEGRQAPKLTHLDMGTDRIANDKDLATALQTHYLSLNNKWYNFLRLRGLTKIDFVRFQAHKNRFADIRKRPDMPDASDRDYAFKPDLIPPVGSNYLIHLLNHPQDYEDECIAYERMPKRTSKLMAGECGWGIELVETLLPERVWALVLGVFGLGSLIFGAVWAARKHDVQGAFGVAAWVCGLAVLVVAWLQACLG